MPEVLRVVVYTLFHYFAFILVGLLAAIVVHAAEREPEILAAAIVIFIIFELGVTGIAALMSEQELIGLHAAIGVKFVQRREIRPGADACECQ